MRRALRVFPSVLLAVLLLFAVVQSAAAAPGRWALVIGNDAYAKVEPLDNAVADAELIAGELKKAGFEVAAINNADRRAMLREVIELARRAEGGGEAVVYFAGHGVQVSNTNYLLPVDFEGSDEAMLPYEAVSLTEVGNQLLDAKARFSLLIIDACRNNPLTTRGGRNLRSGPGLAPMSPATGQMVVYSAGSGQVALDSLGEDDKSPNGIFAREFAREMRTPGVDVRELMLTVRESVERLATSVNHAQRPALYDESRGRFVFHAAPPGAAQPPVASGRPSGEDSGFAAGAARAQGKSDDVIEDETWASVSSSNSRSAYAAYLREYPDGRYASAARVRLEVLEPVPPPGEKKEAGKVAATDKPAAKDKPESNDKPAAKDIPESNDKPAARDKPESKTADRGKPEPKAAAGDKPGPKEAAKDDPASKPPAKPPAKPPSTAKPPPSDPGPLAKRTDRSSPSTRAMTSPDALDGRRFHGLDGQFELTVKAVDGALEVEDFRMTTGKYSGSEFRCGVFRSRIELDEQLNVSAWCSGPVPGTLRLTGRFPRIDIKTGGGAFGGGRIDLLEVPAGK